MKTIGILGGLGPETTSKFYLEVIRLATKKQRPALCIWSLPLNIKKEAEHIATGAHAEHFLTLLQSGTQALNRAGVDEIVIPCNTVHEFHSQLERESNVRVANIIELTANEVARRKWCSALLLATSQTLRSGLFQHALANTGIDIQTPTTADQIRFDQLIQGLLGQRNNPEHQIFIDALAARSQTNNIILGCTDLQLMFKPSGHIIDSLHVLAQHAARQANSVNIDGRD